MLSDRQILTSIRVRSPQSVPIPVPARLLLVGLLSRFLLLGRSTSRSWGSTHVVLGEFLSSGWPRP